MSSGHDIADARLHRQVAALATRGISVEILALGHGVDAPAGATRVHTWRRRSPVGRAALAAEMVARARGRVLMTLDPDVALAAGVAAPARRSQPLVVDAHEDYAALLGDRPWARDCGGLPGRAARGVVRGYLAVASRAALTIVADEEVPPLTARRRLVLPNVPYPGMLPPPHDPEPRPRALYVGDVRRSRGLFAMLEALRRAPAWTCDIVGPVAHADRADVERLLAADPDLAARVRFHGRRPPTEAWSLAPGAWCGFVLLGDTAAFRRAVPSKLHEYLSSGLPILATDLPRQGQILRESGAGALVPVGDDVAVGSAAAEVLNGWSEDPSTVDALRGRARAAAAQEDVLRGHYARFADAVAELL